MPNCGFRERRRAPRGAAERAGRAQKRAADAQAAASCWSTIMPEVRSTTAAVLEDLGHRGVEAAERRRSARAAEGARLRLRPDDQRLCDAASSGTEFLRQARELCPDVPALIITGYAEADAIGDRPDGVEVLLKPFTPAELEAALARMVGAVAPAG